MAEKFGVSRTPIREVLTRLKIEGFVEYIPYSGTFVKEISLKRICELFQIKMALEKFATEQLELPISKTVLEQLQRNIEESKLIIAKDDISMYAKLDEGFHNIIFNGTKNTELINLVSTLNQKILSFRIQVLSLPNQINNSIKEHEEIYFCLLEGDLGTAAKKSEAHAKSIIDLTNNLMNMSKAFKAFY